MPQIKQVQYMEIGQPRENKSLTWTKIEKIVLSIKGPVFKLTCLFHTGVDFQTPNPLSLGFLSSKLPCYT